MTAPAALPTDHYRKMWLGKRRVLNLTFKRIQGGREFDKWFAWSYTDAGGRFRSGVTRYNGHQFTDV